MRLKYALRMAATSFATITLVLTNAYAAPYYWDIDGATAGAGGPSPSGDWTTGGTTWSSSINGTLATAAYATTLLDDLFFSAGVNATGAYTISLADSQQANSLTFRSGIATISGDDGVIDFGATGSGTIRVNNSLTGLPLNANIGSNTSTVIGGSVGLTKTEIGILTLNGTAAHSFTGGLNVTGGTLNLNFANLATPTNLIDGGNALTLGGAGTLSIIGKDTGTTSQTLGAVTVKSGGGRLLGTANGGDSLNITLGSLITTAPGASLLVGAGGSILNAPTITTTSDVDASGTYGGRVVFASSTGNTGYDWATNTGGGGPFTMAAYTGYTDMATSGTDTVNSRITASHALTGDLTTKSLKFENPATAQILDLGVNDLTLPSGGLLLTGDPVAQGPRMIGGSITAGNDGGSYDLVVHQYNASSSIGIGSVGGTINNNTTISSAIVDNGSNPVTLVKNGPGGLVVSGANTFTGGIIVNQGNVVFGNTSLNNNAMTFNANSIIYTSGAQVTTGDITLNNGSQLTICNNNSSFTINANVLGNGGISAANGGQGAITVNLNGTGNTFTGPVRFSANNGTQQATINVASLPDTDTFGSGNITFGAGTASSISHNFNLSVNAEGPVTFDNRRFEMAGLQVNQQINNSSQHALTINADMIVSGNRGKNLQFSAAGGGTNTFAGAIGNHPNPIAPGTIPNAVRKTANGNTLTLASVEGIEVGATITGANLPAGTTITAINPLTREVTLSNSYVGANNATYNVGVIFTVPGVINSVSVNKVGAGTWIFSGDNSYTGPTAINGGSLRINGDQSAATGPVAVNGTSTLGGSGTIGGSVIVAAGAKIAPGDAVGTLSILGDLDISAMAGGAGTLNYELNTPSTSDKINVDGTLSIGSGTFGLDDFLFTNLGGLQNGVYKLITSDTAITGTLNGSDLTGTIGEVDIELRISGNDLELVVGGAVGGDYDVWAAQFAPADLSDPNADFDGDGKTNDQERIFGLDPTSGSSVNPISVPLDAVTGTLSFTRRDPALTGLIYQVWTSTDLIAWEVDENAVLTPGAVVNQVQTVAVQLSEELLVEPKLFLRIGAEAPLPPEPLLFEDFEDGDGGFTVVTLGGTPWAHGAPNSPDQSGGAVIAGANGSLNCWGTNLTGGYAAKTDTSLRSPVIDLSEVSGATLSFARAIDAAANHALAVNVIEAATDTVIANIHPATQDPNFNESPWQTIGPVSLPAGAFGKSVRIEWRFLGDGNGTYNGVYIDNVLVTEIP